MRLGERSGASHMGKLKPQEGFYVQTLHSLPEVIFPLGRNIQFLPPLVRGQRFQKAPLAGLGHAVSILPQRIGS